MAARETAPTGEIAMEAKANDLKGSQAGKPPWTSPAIGNRQNPVFLTATSSDATREREFEEESYRFFLEYRLARKNANLKDFIERFERAVIAWTLREFDGNQKAAARFLGLKYTTLNEKVKKHRIQIVKVTEADLLSASDKNLRIREGNNQIT